MVERKTNGRKNDCQKMDLQKEMRLNATLRDVFKNLYMIGTD